MEDDKVYYIRDLVDIGPECFTDGFIISYKGENYYRACDEWVADTSDGGEEFCVKRVDHPGNVHEAYSGNTREEVPDGV